MKTIEYFKIAPVTSALALGAFCLLSPPAVRGEDQTDVVKQLTFASPSEATNALIRAAKAHDRHAMHEIFGPEVTNLVTGDKAQDDANFDSFAKDLAQHCSAAPDGDKRITLEIGTDAWPFPIPLVQSNGAWIFDTLAGEEEIINRHIGKDEYYAIGVCRAYVQAQDQFAARSDIESGASVYAQKFASDPGKRDGLFWPAADGAPPCRFTELVAGACADSSQHKALQPFHGYCFKILTRQGHAAPGGRRNYIQNGKMTGGFALIAYPVRWGQSGIMTFIVNQDGLVYQRSFGDKTAGIAPAITEYNPDRRWRLVADQGITAFNEP